jgi:hypothetical protein
VAPTQRTESLTYDCARFLRGWLFLCPGLRTRIGVFVGSAGQRGKSHTVVVDLFLYIVHKDPHWDYMLDYAGWSGTVQDSIRRFSAPGMGHCGSMAISREFKRMVYQPNLQEE